MRLLEAITKRSTANSFNSKRINPDTIERILEVARLAPSAKNRQAWRFIVISKLENKTRLCAACYGDKKIMDASHIIAACTTNTSYRLPNGQESYPIDIAMAVAYMDLQAIHEGCATVIYSIYDEAKVRNLLTVPYAMRVVLLLALGYTDEEQSYRKRLSRMQISSKEHW